MNISKRSGLQSIRILLKIITSITTPSPILPATATIRLRNFSTQSRPQYSSLSPEELRNEVTLEFLEKNPGDGQIAIIGFNRPKSRNAMSKNLINRLYEYSLELAHKPDVRVVILRSLIKGTFCAGADLHERYAMTNAQVWHHTVKQRVIMSALDNLPMPVIAAIDGVALGGGLEIALSCDLRVSSNTAKMGLVETKLGIIPGAGGTQRLSRVVGRSKANELIYTGRILNGEQAKEIGLVNASVPQNETGDAAFNKAIELAEEILPNGPVAVRMAKFAINKGSQVDLANGMAFEESCYAQVIPTKDRIEGLLAFKEKRTPKYTGK